ncbi:MAG: hypothetical protein IKW74_01950 [Thermoguttaceae bacterium]|nr:hypothetical protein [Thermoguttaceae bacterium]
MIEGWIDINKIGDGSDSKLCWAAAVANALIYTGWALETPDEVFAQMRALVGKNIPGTALRGLNMYFRKHISTTISLGHYIKILPPSFLWVLRDLRNLGGCAILSLKNGNPEDGHVLTAYDSSLSGYPQNDIRAINSFLCVDSDDSRTGTFVVSLNYDTENRIMKTDYYLNGRQSYVFAATLLLPR